MSNKIRVLVVEDSVTVLKVLVNTFNSDPDIEVVGQAADGAQAVEMTRLLQPDIITMDVTMPHMNGIEATQRIMAEMPTPIIMITASNYSIETDMAFDALQAGALDIVAKPQDFTGESFQVWQADILQKIKYLANLSMK